MNLFKKQITVNSTGKQPTYINITDEVTQAIIESKITDGICTVISPHTTCAVFYEEFSHDFDENGNEFLQCDLNTVLKKIIPDHDSKDIYNYPGEEHYKAVESWPNAAEYLPNGDRTALWNGDAHLKATIIGSSETFEVTEGKLDFGKTGYIYFVDFDTTRARKRKCQVVVVGK